MNRDSKNEDSTTPRGVRKIGVIWENYASASFYRTLFSAFVADIAVPIFNLFLPLLAHRLGASALEVGFVGGASYAVYTFMPFLIGRFSSRTQIRKFFVLGSFGMLSVLSYLYIVISNPLTLIAARVFEGIAWSMLWPAIETALIQDSAKDPRRALGTYNFIWSLAAALGPIIGSSLVFFGSIQLAFFMTDLLMLIALAVNGLPILMARRNVSQEPIEIRAVISSKVSTAQQSKVIERPAQPLSKLLYIGSTALGSSTAAILFTFFPPYSESLGISILLVGFITLVYGLARFSTYFIIGREGVRQRVLALANRKRRIFLFLSLSSFGPLLLLVPNSSGALEFAAFAIVGVGYASAVSIGQVGLMAEAEPNQVGLGAGIFESSVGVGAFIGPVVAGTIAGGYLGNAFFIPIFGYMIFLSVSFLASLVRSRKSKA